MSSSKKFLVILRDDRKLLGMLGGIAADVVILAAIIATACIWYLP